MEKIYQQEKGEKYDGVKAVELEICSNKCRKSPYIKHTAIPKCICALIFIRSSLTIPPFQ